MTMRFIIGVALTLLVEDSLAFSWPSWGRCPDLNVKQNFDLKQYMNQWYMQYGWNTVVDQNHGRCAYGLYELKDGGVVSVFNKQITRTNTTVSINGTAISDDPSKNEGKLTVTFKIDFEFLWWKYVLTISGSYWVIDTDYSNYSVVYSCKNFAWLWHLPEAWLLSRGQDLDGMGLMPQYKKNVTNVLKTINMKLPMFNQVDQKNCPSSYD